jgi:circadian clock protein KaiC
MPGTDTDARLSTGVEGLDAILGGGLHHSGIYIVAGRPGAGKTILSNQVVYAHARRGGRAVYTTLLAETHERMFAQLRTMTFFDPSKVGQDVVYLNGLAAMLEGGLTKLLALLRSMVREQKASLLVIDGLVTATTLSTPLEFKRFISELQTWVSIVGCTVLLLTSVNLDAPVSAEHTMVDGIIELSTERVKLRTFRRLAVTKFRGSAFVEGAHAYIIAPDGMRVFPRFEARPVLAPAIDPERSEERISTGVDGLDAMLGGGLVKASSTLVLAPTGCGKTVLGLQFLGEGARKGERALYFGFFEQPELILAKGERLGFGLSRAHKEGTLHISWRRPAETNLDAIAYEILASVEKHRIDRLFLDGFAALHSAGEPDRISAVFATLTAALVSRGVTLIVSDETHELFVKNVEVPTQFVSGLFHNILFLRRVETSEECLETSIAVMKTRDSAKDSRIWDFDIDERGMRVSALRRRDGGKSTIASGRGAASRSKKTSSKKKAGKGRR